MFYLIYLSGTWRCQKRILLVFKGLEPRLPSETATADGFMESKSWDTLGLRRSFDAASAVQPHKPGLNL